MSSAPKRAAPKRERELVIEAAIFRLRSNVALVSLAPRLRAMKGLVALQAKVRGDRARAVHVARARSGEALVCPFVASSSEVAECMVNAATLTEGDVCFDLGCGDGAICLEALSRGGRILVRGFDIDPLLVSAARRRCEQFKDRVVITECDILNVDLSSASVIFIFLVPSCLTVLEPRLRTALDSGSRIICYKYGVPSWIAVSTFSTEDVIRQGGRESVYLYVQ